MTARAASEPLSPLLTLTEVFMQYPALGDSGPVRVVDRLSFEVRAGELVCLAGRSGSGKTTVLMIAAGLRRPTSGSVSWAGRTLTSLDADTLVKERGRRIGVVFQSSALIESLRASENVALPGMPEGVDQDGRARALRLLSELGLEGRSNHYPAQVSGGEQQRVALARALFRDPALLLVDEPTANLDRSTGAAIVELLASLRTPQRGVLAASHDPGVIGRADRVITLE